MLDKINRPYPEINLTTRVAAGSETPAATGAEAQAKSTADTTEASGSSPVEEFRRSRYTREIELDRAIRAGQARGGDKLKGFVLGDLLIYGANVAGTETALHEYAHAVTIKGLYPGTETYIQIDGFENIANFLKDPSGQNLGRILTAYDVHQDGAAGYTSYSPGSPSSTTEKIGHRAASAAISAAGTLSTELPILAGWAAGFKLRHKYPVLGYTMMTASGISHLTNMLYPWSAVGASPEAALSGHDWAGFAADTGIHPAITATALSLSLPALAVGLYMVEHHNQEKQKDHLALARLINSDQVSPRELEILRESYGRSKEMTAAEDRLHSLLSTPLDQVKPGIDKELSRASRDLQKEYNRFSDHLIKELRSQVDAEKAVLNEQPGESASWIKAAGADLKAEFSRDKLGTALQMGTVAGATALAGASTVRAVGLLAPQALAGIGGIMGRAVFALAPGVGLLGAAHGIYQATKTFTNPEASKGDKAAAASVAFFTTMAAAGAAIPGLGLPAAIVGIAGVAGTHGVRWLAGKLKE